ncbi:C4-dicarboxylate transporter DctA [Carnimonas nigrificans]|uniref:C4-dicarboxylate transporter DctA n=1 Tax=Carnimonas nigrificans TaxID=64323 RepID=UPI000471E113|nr:C4-dicarboxylate transporter DctA [Carnimonas nigrificans]
MGTAVGRRFGRSIFWQVVIALIAGALLGWLLPETAATFKPLGDSFIKLIKMVIAPLVFLIVVHGITSNSNLRHVGRLVGKTIIYFEVVTIFALILGLVVSLLTGIGSHTHIQLDEGESALEAATHGAHMNSLVDFLTGLIPNTFIGAFADGDVLQVLILSVLFGVALTLSGEKGRPIVDLIDRLSTVMFRMMGILVRAAPVGVFGSVAYMVGNYGLDSLSHLVGFLALYFATCLIFIVVVLGAISGFCGVSLKKLVVYLRAELGIVFGTTASDVVLPQLMSKLEWLGVGRSTVGLVIPTGYSFNLDGFSIYITMAVVFIAQFTGTALSTVDLVLIIAVAMVTSKGAHGVPGSAIVILAATLSAIPSLPVAALAVILPIDWFVGIARALTNVLGNCVATIAIGKWEGDFDRARAQRVLDGEMPYHVDMKAHE